jgi:hypothetical protein
MDTGTITVVAPLVVIGLVGVSLAVRARKSAVVRADAAHWAHTMGTVVSATVQVSHTGTARREQPLVFYAFQVNGEVFQGQRVRVADQFGRVRVAGAPSSASSTIARYPAGSSVVVYYDPQNPGKCALEL